MKVFVLGVIFLLATAAGLNEDAHATVFLHPHGMTKPMVDNMTFFDDNTWILESEHGYLNFHDYNKGLHITRLQENGVCYVFPVKGLFMEGMKLKKQLERGITDYNGVIIGTFEIVSQASIVDTSFLPPAAKPFCLSGYVWAKPSQDLINPKEMDEWQEGIDMADQAFRRSQMEQRIWKCPTCGDVINV